MPTLHTVDRADRPGRLSTMAGPTGGDALAGELAALAALGVGEVVSLLTDAEVRALDLLAEPALAAQAGLAFHRLPTADFGVPERGAAEALARGLAARLSAGDHVVVHCRGGIGRSSVLAALVLVLEGDDPEVAWGRLAAARGVPVPETAEQRAFVAGA